MNDAPTPSEAMLPDGPSPRGVGTLLLTASSATSQTTCVDAVGPPEHPPTPDDAPYAMRKRTLDSTCNNAPRRAPGAAMALLASDPSSRALLARKSGLRARSVVLVSSEVHARRKRSLAFPRKMPSRMVQAARSSALSVGSSEADENTRKVAASSNRSYPPTHYRPCRLDETFAKQELPLGEHHWTDYLFARFGSRPDVQSTFQKNQTKLLEMIRTLDALASTRPDDDEVATQLSACKAMVAWFRVGDHVVLMDIHGKPALLKTESRNLMVPSVRKRNSMSDSAPVADPVTATIRRDLHNGTYDIRLHKTSSTIQRAVPHHLLRPKVRRKPGIEAIRPSSTRNFLLLDGMVRLDLGARVMVTYRDPLERRYGYFMGLHTNGTAIVQYDEKDVDAKVDIKDLSAAADQDVTDELLAMVQDMHLTVDDRVILTGFRVLTKHPLLKNVQPCTVTRDNGNGTFDLQFLDGICVYSISRDVIEIEPSVHEMQLKQLEAQRSAAAVALVVGQLVAAYSPRYLRYCSGHIQSMSDGFCDVVFDYGERVTQIPVTDVTSLPDATLQRCGNLISYSKSMLGPEEGGDARLPMGHRVMARLCGSPKYFAGVVEEAETKTYRIRFQSSVLDPSVPRSHVYSVESCAVVFVKPTPKPSNATVTTSTSRQKRKRSSLAQRVLNFFTGSTIE
ncbi:hypothetical protein SPRG_08125 [Saprolegnia parasitica CBS 223.65]|uniref:Tudor domain-containing protein n=1 Tax=Saprolegnia parasitica (strain CBS 223.65) TaxID=695850 RepID=A0A067C7U1_SAPPC|nr:hypothetical protein SPRG_08125 [Saprolegnia parasitica CBS 223.65]KDO26834.1 hypothetical protein SPRG_08125 [Saprolegnia parasitica CBS 223.65]|eukprot:XP_012202480.1 hypothetical protein SPRG_08125 [Saprolegnia parasitica CBS 223.65]